MDACFCSLSGRRTCGGGANVLVRIASKEKRFQAEATSTSGERFSVVWGARAGWTRSLMIYVVKLLNWKWLHCMQLHKSAGDGSASGLWWLQKTYFLMSDWMLVGKRSQSLAWHLVRGNLNRLCSFIVYWKGCHVVGRELLCIQAWKINFRLVRPCPN